MDRIKLLYIFTSGTFSSANNRQWFKIFKKDQRINVSILISDCSDEEKRDFYNQYGNIYNIIFFKPFDKMMLDGFYSRLKYVLKIARKIDCISPDIIHIHGCYYSYLVKPLFFLHSRPKVIYNVWGQDYLTMYHTSIKHRFIINYLFRRSDLIWTNWFAMTDAVRLRLSKSKKIKTIFWGLEQEAFQRPDNATIERVRKKFGIYDDKYILLSAKGFKPSNNQMEILKALSQLDAGLDYMLILHCDRINLSMDKQFSEFIETHGLADNVLISHQHLNYDEMKALFCIADLSFVLPDKDQITRTLTETIFMDTNLLLNDIEPFRYLNFLYGFKLDLVDVHNNTLLTQAITSYIQNKPIPDWDYQKAVLKRIFDFESKGDDYFKIYRKLIAK